MTKAEKEAYKRLREEKDREYAEMAAEWEARIRSPDPKEEQETHALDKARALRRKLQSYTGRLPNRHSQQLVMPPVGREPKWTPYSDEPDWYTPQDVEQYSWEGSRSRGLLSMKESHERGHSEFPHRDNRPVIGCQSCQSHVYRRHRRTEMKQDIVSWLGGHCYLCGEPKTPGEFRTVRLWGGKSTIGTRLHHAAGDIQGEVMSDYVLVCHPCYRNGGRKRVFEKVSRTTKLALPPPRQGRHPKVRP